MFSKGKARHHDGEDLDGTDYHPRTTIDSQRNYTLVSQLTEGGSLKIELKCFNLKEGCINLYKLQITDDVLPE